MSGKEISVPDEVYEALDAARRDDESVADVVRRMVETRAAHPLFDIVGLLDDDEVERLQRERRRFRDDLGDRLRE